MEYVQYELTHRLQIRMWVRKGQSWDRAILLTDKGLYQLEKILK